MKADSHFEGAAGVIPDRPSSPLLSGVEPGERFYRIAFALLLLLSAALRVYRLGHFSYWVDEVFESFLAHGSWSFLWQKLRFDAFHPPLDYALLKLAQLFHPSDAALKIVPALWGVGTVAAAGVLLRRRGGRTLALLAMTLLAANPFFVRYSQELRPYSLGLCLEILALLLLDVALERQTLLATAGFLFAALATASTLYLAAVGLGVAAAALLADDSFSQDASRRAAARRFLLRSPAYGAALAIAYLPWWPVVLHAARSSYPAVSHFSLSHFGRLIGSFSIAAREGGYSFGPPKPFYAVFAIFVLLVAAGFFAAAGRKGLRFLAGWLLCGMIVLQIVLSSAEGRSGFRYYSGAAIALPLIAAVGLSAVARRSRVLAAAALLSILGYQAAGLAGYYRSGRYDWRPLARYLERSPDSEKIFADNQTPILCLAYYMCGPRWLSGEPCRRTFVNLNGRVAPADLSAKQGESSWLVLSTLPGNEALREWSSGFPSLSFPKAENVILRRIEAAHPRD